MSTTTQKSLPDIELLNPTRAEYKSILDQFQRGWTDQQGKGLCPATSDIQHIYIINKIYKNYETCATPLRKDKSIQVFGSGGRGNEQRRFHGTFLAATCTLRNGSAQLCNFSSTGCYICSIITGGFRLDKVGATTNFSRFGSGIYFSASSSKGADYSRISTNKKQVPNASIYGLLVCKIMVGKAYSYTNDNTTITQPPQGYHSVLGEASRSGSLNINEVVIYNENAICPRYVIVFRKDWGANKIYPTGS